MAGNHKKHHRGEGEHVEHHGVDNHGTIKHHEHPMAEHKHKRARGGKVGNEPMEGVKESEPAPKDVYAGKESNVVKEADKRKHGGKVEGKMAHMHLGRPGRKKGGRVGSDQSPLSSAAHVTEAGAHKANDGCD